MEELEKCLISPNAGRQLLEYYQGQNYYKMNRLFRKVESSLTDSEKELKAKIKKKMNLFLKTSNDISIYRNKTVYREDQNLKLEWLRLNAGQIICFPAYLSSYRSTEHCKDREVYKIKTLPKRTNAFDILKFNPKHPEKEVLFLASTNFEIIISKSSILLKETKKAPQIVLYQDTEGYFREFKGEKSLSDMNLI